MLHLRRRVRNARNNHRTSDDVGWIIPADAERPRSPDSGPALQLSRNNEAQSASVVPGQCHGASRPEVSSG